MFDDLLLLAQYRAPGRFRGMCGKHGFYAHRIEQRLQLFGRDARGFQLDERVLETPGLVVTDLAQVFAPAPDAVNFLRRVGHLEIGRKTADDLQGNSRVEICDELGKLFTGFLVVFAAADRAQPGVFDEVEKFIAALFADQVADHRAERAHVVAQGLVLVLEHDVLAAQSFGCPGAHRNSFAWVC